MTDAFNDFNLPFAVIIFPLFFLIFLFCFIFAMQFVMNEVMSRQALGHFRLRIRPGIMAKVVSHVSRIGSFVGCVDSAFVPGYVLDGRSM